MSKILGTDNVTLANGSVDLAVAAVAIYTKAVCIKPAQFFGLSYIFTSATGAPDVKIEMEQSFQLPATEGAADANYWAEPENTNDIEASLTTETIRHKAINPMCLPYIRFKITPNAGHTADTVGKMWLSRWEDC